MKMYTIDGVEVSVVKKIKEGYLGRTRYGYDVYNELDDDDEMYGDINFYEKLYVHPPTEKYAKEVNELITQRDTLTKEVNGIRLIKMQEEETLNKINKFPILKMLTSYLTQSFSFYLDLNRYDIVKKDGRFWSTRIKAVSLKDDGWCLYRLERENSESYDDDPFMVFDTIDECVDYSRTHLIEKFKQFRKNEYFKWEDLKKFNDNIRYTNPIKKDEKYLASYNETMNFLIDRQKEKEAKKLQQELVDFEEKKKKLENLGLIV